MHHDCVSRHTRVFCAFALGPAARGKLARSRTSRFRRPSFHVSAIDKFSVTIGYEYEFHCRGGQNYLGNAPSIANATILITSFTCPHSSNRILSHVCTLYDQATKVSPKDVPCAEMRPTRNISRSCSAVKSSYSMHVIALFLKMFLEDAGSICLAPEASWKYSLLLVASSSGTG